MNVRELIHNFITTELVSGNIAIQDSDSLIESGIIDSLGIMKLIGFIEDNMSVTIDDMELVPENFANIEAITTLVEKKL